MKLELAKRGMGRPTVMTDEVLEKLEYMFSMGATDEMACTLANINTGTLYNYQKENPDFLERKNILKEMTTWQARANVTEKIQEGDVAQSNWWLERKAKDEFSTRTESLNANVEVSNLTEEQKEKLAYLMNGES